LVEGQRAGIFKMSCDFSGPEEKRAFGKLSLKIWSANLEMNHF
jgi:hypothetical protein